MYSYTNIIYLLNVPPHKKRHVPATFSDRPTIPMTSFPGGFHIISKLRIMNCNNESFLLDKPTRHLIAFRRPGPLLGLYEEI